MNLISAASAADMIRIEGQTFNMGSQSHHREEGPIRPVTVSTFLIGKTEVTNAELGAFVDATGYVTTAERGFTQEERPGWPPKLLEPGSMVFAQRSEAIDLDNPNKWWRWVAGAN